MGVGLAPAGSRGPGPGQERVGWWSLQDPGSDSVGGDMSASGSLAPTDSQASALVSLGGSDEASPPWCTVIYT